MWTRTAEKWPDPKTAVIGVTYDEIRGTITNAGLFYWDEGQHETGSAQWYALGDNGWWFAVADQATPVWWAKAPEA